MKLPVRWMALESLNDGIFNEKTDVVRVLSRDSRTYYYLFLHIETCHCALTGM